MVLQSYQNPSRPTMDLGSGTQCPPLGDAGPCCKSVVNLPKKWCSCPTTVVEIMSFGKVSNLWSDPDLPHATLIKHLVRWHSPRTSPHFPCPTERAWKGKGDHVRLIGFPTFPPWVGFDAQNLWWNETTKTFGNTSPKKRGPLSKGKDSSNHYFLGENC